MSLSDTPDGIAITFVTTTDAVEVRRRAAAFAGRISQRGVPVEPAGTNGRTTLPASAHAEAISGGARLVVATTNPDERDALRTAVRRRELPMREGDCD
jgi:hypothetical protein